MEFDETFCHAALSMDPAPDIEMEYNGKKMETIEDFWQIPSDEPVRKIKWCSLKVLEETTQTMRVFLGGTFERINPLEYHAQMNQNKVISIYEKNQNLVINLPKIQDFSTIIMNALIGTAYKKNRISEFGAGIVQMSYPISSDKLDLKYQFDILYLQK